MAITRNPQGYWYIGRKESAVPMMGLGFPLQWGNRFPTKNDAEKWLANRSDLQTIYTVFYRRVAS